MKQYLQQRLCWAESIELQTDITNVTDIIDGMPYAMPIVMT